MRTEKEIRDKLELFEFASMTDGEDPIDATKIQATRLILKWVLGDLDPADD